ncbi:hypothetical protein [Chitinophaga sp. Ak27]|uniref:hypothetical protein n=1 Tax=Chitinophaga sp. Ak27 TaxID=2726116 RepID=UPI00145D3F25|nr:hypothetical protein [Chitinophaga sp. Ak27]NLU96173.1 hypothetical protein [Chitinophaga sp. Ak27]
MKILKIVFVLLMLTGVKVWAQQPTSIDARLQGTWHIRSVTATYSHMQTGALLQQKEITASDSIQRLSGSIFLRLEFAGNECTAKQAYSRQTWSCASRDTGVLEFKQLPLGPEKMPNDPQQQPPLRWPYRFDQTGQLTAGPFTIGYMDASGKPVKVLYSCHYIKD